MSNRFWESHIVRFTICASLILVVLIIPVSAATIDISLGGTPPTNWAMKPGNNMNDTVTLTVTVSPDATGWTVKVKDNSNNGKPQSYAGRMVEWDGAQYVSNPKVLGSNLSVQGGTGTGYTGLLVSALDNNNQDIVTSSTTGTFSNIPITYRQTLAYTDPHLTTDHSYQIIITYTGGVS